jgi:hypothetical protein
MKLKRTGVLFLATVALVLLSVFVFSERSSAQLGEATTVKLYSGNQLVATWENAHKGRVEGTTYVFTIPPQDKEVRISGTYSVEVIR